MVGKEEEEELVSGRGRGGDSDALRALDSLTLSGRRKGRIGGVKRRLYQLLEDCDARWIQILHQREAAAAKGRTARGLAINAPRRSAETQERRPDAGADGIEREEVEFKGGELVAGEN